MGNNAIHIYQENTRTITCDISSSVSLSGFESYFTCKETKSGDIVFASTGSLTLYSGSWTGSYILDQADTMQDPGVYFYDIVAESGSVYHTIVQDDMIIKDSVLY